MKGSSKRYGIDRFNRQLLDRIDNMNDGTEFSPYEPSKKIIVQDNELFDDDIYDNEDADNYEVTKSDKADKANSGAFIVLAIVIALVAGAVIFINVLQGALTA